MADDEAYDPTLIRELTPRYYDYINHGVKAPPCIVVARYAAIANPHGAPVVPARGGYIRRRVQIKLQDLQEYGFTAGCPACVAAQTGGGGRDGLRRGDRKQRVTEKMDQYLAEQVAAGDGQNVDMTAKTDAANIEPQVVDQTAANTEDVELQEGQATSSDARIQTPQRDPAVRRFGTDN